MGWLCDCEEPFEYFRYHRSQNPYTPPNNVAKIVDKLKADAKLITGFGGNKFSMEEKFNFLLLCSQEFNHTVSNSWLHEIENIGNSLIFKKLFRWILIWFNYSRWCDPILQNTNQHNFAIGWIAHARIATKFAHRTKVSSLPRHKYNVQWKVSLSGQFDACHRNYISQKVCWL